MSIFLRMKFLRICPYGRQHLEKLVTKCKREMLFLTILVLPVLVFFYRLFEVRFGFYLAECIILVLYIILTEVPNYHVFQRESRVYRDLIVYFSRVKHRYLVCGHGANAVIDAAEGMSYEIICLAEEIYRILLGCNRKEKVRECILFHPLNRYLKMFLLQIFEISENGDMHFAENIEYLRMELMDEIYRRRKYIHEFAGYAFITIIPFFSMPVLKQWGIAFTPEMEAFYGYGGRILETITFGVTLFVYRMILQSKEIYLQEGKMEQKFWSTDFFFETGIINRLILYIERHGSGKVGKRIQKLIIWSGERVRYGKLCVKMLLYGFGAFIFFAVTIRNIMVSFLGGLCIGAFPLFNLYFRGKRIRDSAVHEVQQFQSIILMERKMQGVTVVDLLEDMELFSKCFRNSLRRCINMYSSDPKGALLMLKEEGSALHPGFGELADAFLSVDEAGIKLSFAEVENNRHLLNKMTKLEAEIHIERKKDSTDLLARVPSILAVGLYFIIPVFGYSINGVYEVFRMLEEMQL